MVPSRFCLCFALSALIAPATAVDDEFAAALRYQQSGELAKALHVYQRVVSESPDRVDALSNLGLVYGELGQFENAIATFQRALQLDPDQAGVRLNLAMTYLEAQQYENAGTQAAKVAGRQPSNMLAHYVLALALLKRDRLEDGITELEIVRKAQPANVKVASTLTSAYLRRHDLEKARTLVQEVLSPSDTAEAHLMVGTFYLVTGDGRDAVIELQRAQSLDPRLTQLGSTLAQAYALTGNSDTATNMFKAQIDKDPSNFEANAFLGWLYLEDRDFAKAGKYLGVAASIHPHDPGIDFQLARLARAQNDNTRALEFLQRVVLKQPDNAPAHVLLAQTYYSLKRTDEGKKEREIANRLNAEQQQRQVRATPN